VVLNSVTMTVSTRIIIIIIMLNLLNLNLKLINNSNKIISNSFWAYSSIEPEKMYIPEVLFSQSIITGCTILINDSAKRKCLPIPKEALMHDWWIALRIAKYGKIENINTPTILYRQHENNFSGIKKLGIFSSLIPNISVALNMFFKKLKVINTILGYKINNLKALLFLLYFSYKRYKNILLKKEILLKP